MVGKHARSECQWCLISSVFSVVGAVYLLLTIQGSLPPMAIQAFTDQLNESST